MNTPFTLKLIAACSILTGATAAFSAGSHAGGHTQASVGKAGAASQVSRTVTVDMADSMRFKPSSIAVRQGETVRLVVKNSGKLKHELVLGTEKELKAHYEVMKQHPEMEHEEPNMVMVAPGKTGEVIWTFTQTGKVHFACLQPGHLDAGMKGMVTVSGQRRGQTRAAAGKVRAVSDQHRPV